MNTVDVRELRSKVCGWQIYKSSTLRHFPRVYICGWQIYIINVDDQTLDLLEPCKLEEYENVNISNTKGKIDNL